MNKLITVALCCVLISGCGTSAVSHSDYFIVGFDPGTLEPSSGGKITLGNALREAGGATRVVIEVAVSDSPANADKGALVQRRAAELEQEFIKAGVAAGHVQLQTRQVGDSEFVNRQDSLIVHLAFGTGQ